MWTDQSRPQRVVAVPALDAIDLGGEQARNHRVPEQPGLITRRPTPPPTLRIDHAQERCERGDAVEAGGVRAWRH